MLIITTATRVGLNTLGFLGLSVTLYLGKTVFIPLVIAAILSVILWPAAKWLHLRLKFPWAIACFTVIGGLILVNLGVFIGIAAAIPRIVQDLPNPNNTAQQKDLYKKIRTQVQTISPGSVDEVLPADPDQSSVFAYVKKTLEGDFITTELLSLGKLGVTWLWQSVLIVFILLFLLLEGDMLAKQIRAIFGESSIMQGKVTSVLRQMAESVQAYLVWRTIVNCGLGLFLGVVYHLLGLRQPWTWALITALFCYVPYLGTILAGMPPVLDAFIYCSAWHALFVLVLYTAVVTFEGYIIVPVVMGRSMDLNATTVMISCLFWDLVWGMPGLFLAMPLMAGFRAVCMHVEGWEPWGKLMSTSRWVEATEEAMKKQRGDVPQEEDVDRTIVMEEPLKRKPLMGKKEKM
ncbi:MAG: AI-2E family transporter [Planctomycetes bacterium]|nr:AI-2E family transporter [Planctomycetota bacterium]